MVFALNLVRYWDVDVFTSGTIQILMQTKYLISDITSLFRHLKFILDRELKLFGVGSSKTSFLYWLFKTFLCHINNIPKTLLTSF